MLRTKRKTEKESLKPLFAIRCDGKEDYQSEPDEYIFFVSSAQRHGKGFVKADFP
jgi:hypothetical protein